MPSGEGRIIPDDGRFAVIGAGAAGIAAVINLRNAGIKNVTVFEATSRIGGTWVYSPALEDVHSSIYKSLRCNVPKQSMCYRNHPFPDNVPSFPAHEHVLEYLQAVAEKENIFPHIRFNCKVARVEPENSSDYATSWLVQTYKSSLNKSNGCSLDGQFRYSPLSDGDVSVTPDCAQVQPNGIETQCAHACDDIRNSRTKQSLHDCHLSQPERFDAVVVCSGHFSVPSPWLPENASSFRGKIKHSHYYRQPDKYAGKKVVIVGAGPSGTDIGLELARHGADVILSHKHGKRKGKYGGIVTQAAPVKRCRNDGSLELEDGEVICNVDELLLCTGYVYSFPFLSENSGISVNKDGRAIFGLLMHCLSTRHITLSIIGMVYKVLPFPLFEDQVAFVAAVLTGKVPFRVDAVTIRKLLLQEMDRRDPEKPEKDTHSLDDEQWEYRRTLAKWSGRSLPPDSAKEMYNDSRAARKNDPLRYRDRQYEVFGDGPGDVRVTLYGEDVTGCTDPASPD